MKSDTVQDLALLVWHWRMRSDLLAIAEHRLTVVRSFSIQDEEDALRARRNYEIASESLSMYISKMFPQKEEELVELIFDKRKRIVFSFIE